MDFRLDIFKEVTSEKERVDRNLERTGGNFVLCPGPGVGGRVVRGTDKGRWREFGKRMVWTLASDHSTFSLWYVLWIIKMFCLCPKHKGKAFKGFKRGCVWCLYTCVLKRSLQLQSEKWFGKARVDDRACITDQTLLRTVTWKQHVIYKRIKLKRMSRNLIWYSPFRPADVANFQDKWLHKVSQKRKSTISLGNRYWRLTLLQGSSFQCFKMLCILLDNLHNNIEKQVDIIISILPMRGLRI